eukprot:TRINITY_DN1514_c0_g1_i1.p5 TRINITY_DN1514_c0_g1~~TRINITY_DN1514_c0_g1_i1.p5  ORF type:complete len:69 (-),score=5.69 TRINITY_DN1514_c0_g1_i1:770-976(-)
MSVELYQASNGKVRITAGEDSVVMTHSALTDVSTRVGFITGRGYGDRGAFANVHMVVDSLDMADGSTF